MTVRFTEEQRLAIARDPRPQHVVAEAWGISRSYVRGLRHRMGCAREEYAGARGPRIKAEPPARKPLPVRHYRPVSWDLEPEAR